MDEDGRCPVCNGHLDWYDHDAWHSLFLWNRAAFERGAALRREGFDKRNVTTVGRAPDPVEEWSLDLAGDPTLGGDDE